MTKGGDRELSNVYGAKERTNPCKKEKGSLYCQ
jgi:hypothetical protein